MHYLNLNLLLMSELDPNMESFNLSINIDQNDLILPPFYELLDSMNIANDKFHISFEILQNHLKKVLNFYNSKVECQNAQIEYYYKDLQDTLQIVNILDNFSNQLQQFDTKLKEIRHKSYEHALIDEEKINKEILYLDSKINSLEYQQLINEKMKLSEMLNNSKRNLTQSFFQKLYSQAKDDKLNINFKLMKLLIQLLTNDLFITDNSVLKICSNYNEFNDLINKLDIQKVGNKLAVFVNKTCVEEYENFIKTNEEKQKDVNFINDHKHLVPFFIYSIHLSESIINSNKYVSLIQNLQEFKERRKKCNNKKKILNFLITDFQNESHCHKMIHSINILFTYLNHIILLSENREKEILIEYEIEEVYLKKLNTYLEHEYRQIFLLYNTKNKKIKMVPKNSIIEKKAEDISKRNINPCYCNYINY